MLNKLEIIKIISPEIYAIEAEDARLAAPMTGRGDATIWYDSDTPHTIQDLIWYQENGLSDTERVQLMFEVYQDIPCYAQVMIFGYDTLSPKAQQVFWHHVRDLLSQPDDALAMPLTYMLWCDFFEVPDLCGIAWKALYDSQSNDYLLTRLLNCCGPVPYALKFPLYQQKLPDLEWHTRIYQSLYASYHDIYGDIDQDDARRLLAQLQLPNTRELKIFRAALAKNK